MAETALDSVGWRTCGATVLAGAPSVGQYWPAHLRWDSIGWRTFGAMPLAPPHTTTATAWSNTCVALESLTSPRQHWAGLVQPHAPSPKLPDLACILAVDAADWAGYVDLYGRLGLQWAVWMQTEAVHCGRIGAAGIVPSLKRWQLAMTVVAATWIAACGSEPTNDPGNGAVNDIETSTDVTAVSELPDGVEQDTGLTDAVDLQDQFGGSDGPGQSDVLACPGGAGCSCSADSECNIGICAEFADSKRCAAPCDGGCPSGSTCATSGTNGQPTLYCAPLGVRQCAPCISSVDCIGAWAVPAECVSAGAAGSFCATPCQVNAQCPPESICAVMPSGAGKACQPVDGLQACPCSAWAKAAGAETICQVEEGTTQCPGSRLCGASGLTVCNKLPGETCIDLGCKGAKAGSPCEDGDPCTQSECIAGTCQTTTNLCKCQSDGDCLDDDNLCNGKPYCDKSAVPYGCKVNPATVVACSPSTVPCKDNTCQPATGKCEQTGSKDGAVCEDGDPCTQSKCQGGTCTVSDANLCECQGSSDCPDDANLCNGKPYCELTSHTCQPNPATVVKCPPATNPCEVAVCSPGSGLCNTAPLPENSPCDDGQLCSTGGICKAGSCKPGDPICGCKSDTDCAKEEDGNLCNGTLSCDKPSGKCLLNPASVVTCDSSGDTTCSTNTCNAKTGLCSVAFATAGKVCSDDNSCTVNDTCQQGVCVSGSNTCECKTTADCTAKEDGNLCNGKLVCDTGAAKCKVDPASVVSCSQSGLAACEEAVCVPGTGLCVPKLATGKACSDGNGCTTADLCTDGGCVGKLACSKQGMCSSGTCTCNSGYSGDGIACEALLLALSGSGCTLTTPLAPETADYVLNCPLAAQNTAIVVLAAAGATLTWDGLPIASGVAFNQALPQLGSNTPHTLVIGKGGQQASYTITGFRGAEVQEANLQEAYLKASNSDAADWFGSSVAISGDTIVVGAQYEDSAATGVDGNQLGNSATDSGAAYVFVRSGNTWVQQAYLKASNAGAGDRFGVAVAISGDTIVVGADGEKSDTVGVGGVQSNNAAVDSGAAYVFVRSGGSWSQQAYLKATNTGANDHFGYSVAVFADTIVVGAYGEDSSAAGVGGLQKDEKASNSGAAYVFVRTRTSWRPQAYLKASNPGADDQFGHAVAMYGDTVVIGAKFEDSESTGVGGLQTGNSAPDSGAAYLFVRSGVSWSQQAYLKASNAQAGDKFGGAVAISADTVAIGAVGEASDVTGVGGTESDNSAPASGAAYVFVRDSGIWSQQAYLKASNTDANDIFGGSVAVSGDTIVVGAEQEASNATGALGQQSDNTAPDSGAAYVFVRSGTTWSQQAYRKASNSEPSDSFGRAVAIAGDTIVVASPFEDSAATGVGGDQSDNLMSSAGAAYVFGPGVSSAVRPTISAPGCWVSPTMIDEVTSYTLNCPLSAQNAVVTVTAAAGTTLLWDGVPLASGATVVVELESLGDNPGHSLVVVSASKLVNYTISSFRGISVQDAYLKASNTGAGDYFGYSVAISGDTIVVGANDEDSNATGIDGNQSQNYAENSGAAYVFVRSGNTWEQQAYLKASNAKSSQSFGISVAISGDTIVVGANGEDSKAVGVNGSPNTSGAYNSGSAYVFVRSGTAWSQQAYIKASNPGGYDNFGRLVAISGDTIVVGAHQEDSDAVGIDGNQTNNGSADSGATYVFVRIGTAWSQQAYLKASNTGGGDYFGESVAISGDTIVVGAYGEDSNAVGIDGSQSNNGSTDSGAAYVFVRSGDAWSQQAYLKASNTGGGDNFGGSVAISGDTIVVGARYEDSTAEGIDGNQSNNGSTDSGAAYVFVRSGTAWSQQAYVKASNTAGKDYFGRSVAISGNTIVVGANEAANVLVRSGTSWSHHAYLQASNAGTGDSFGASGAISGGTIVVGAYTEDSAATGIEGYQDGNSATDAGAVYVFGPGAGHWDVLAVTASACVVSSSGDDVVTGYRLRCPLTAQSTTVTVTAPAETTLSWDGAVVASGEPIEVPLNELGDNPTHLLTVTSKNKVTTFPVAAVRGITAQEAYVKSAASGTSENFGYSIAISGDTMVVGTATEKSYVFVRNGASWSQQATLTASNGQVDRFGCSVAISGDTIVVGADREDSNATGIDGLQTNNGSTDSGAAYVFVRSGTNWSQQAYLKASNTGSGDWFGGAVAVSGDTIAVGAHQEDSESVGVDGLQSGNGASDSGATYIFVRDGNKWTQQAYLKASNTEAEDWFGKTIGLSGDTLVVGARQEDSHATSVGGLQTSNSAAASGAAYVFVRSGGTWSQEVYLKASNAEAGDNFGSAVAVSGNTVVVGANMEDSTAVGIGGLQSNNNAFDSGAAYVFVRNGTNWSQQAYIKASNTTAGDSFGSAIAVFGDTVVVGAFLEDSPWIGATGPIGGNTAPDSGAAYVFVRNGTSWFPQTSLKAFNTGPGDFFGYAVAISGDAIAVGGYLEDGDWTGIDSSQYNESASNKGAVYVFR